MSSVEGRKEGRITEAVLVPAFEKAKNTRHTSKAVRLSAERLRGRSNAPTICSGNSRPRHQRKEAVPPAAPARICMSQHSPVICHTDLQAVEGYLASMQSIRLEVQKRPDSEQTIVMLTSLLIHLQSTAILATSMLLTTHAFTPY
jgi:hypothetical protein